MAMGNLGMISGVGKANLKVLIDEATKDRFDAALARQGTTLTVGVSRLIETFLALPEELQAVFLGQLRGKGKDSLVRSLLEGMEKEGTKDRGSKR